MKCLLLYFELCTCVHAYACVCDHGQVLYGSNYWQRGPSDTHSASLSGPNGIYLPPPLPLSLSVSRFLSFSHSVFFTPSLFLYPCLSLWTKLLSYEPQTKGQGETPFYFLIGNKKPGHILIHITHFQFVQTSPENTSTN